MRFAELSKTCSLLKSVRSRKKKVQHICSLLQKAKPDEVGIVARFICGRVFPQGSGKVLHVGSSLLRCALKRRIGEGRGLLVKEVYKILENIASVKGKGSREKRVRLLSSLFLHLSDDELSCLLSIITDSLRQGAAEGLVLEGIGEAFKVSLDTLKKARAYIQDIGDIAIAAHKGTLSFVKVECAPFAPVACMLACQAQTLESVIEQMGEAAFEYKLDGARVQIHRSGESIQIFTRKLLNVTEFLPEIVEFAKKVLGGHGTILEGEVIAEKEGRALPFQYLMRRFKRVHKSGECVPIKFYAFDILWLDGASLLQVPYMKRRKLLCKILPKECIVPSIVTASLKEAEQFLQEAIKKGHEGVIAKKLQSPYFVGERKRDWLKVKRAKTLDLVIVAAEWGHGRREGWLSNYHLAAWGERELKMVGKTFKGLTDEEFAWMTEKLLFLREKEVGGIVYTKPKVVVEVAFDEVQRSSQYESGFALRFARIKRIRDDKSAEDADTLERVAEIFKGQSKYAGVLQTNSV